VTYEKDLTGLVVIDPYNDFISEGGKVWDRLKGVAEANHCIPRDLEVHCADSEGSLVAQVVQMRYVGRDCSENTVLCGRRVR
jgi:hypothetical protein